MPQFDLTGRKARVTWAVRGIGESTARAPVAAGSSVLIGEPPVLTTHV